MVELIALDYIMNNTNLIYELVLEAFKEYLSNISQQLKYSQYGLEPVPFNNNSAVVSYNGFRYLVVIKDSNEVYQELWQEPLGNTKNALIFPYDLREGNFFFCMWSKEYGYKEIGPYESYHEAMLDMHSIKGKVMMKDDGVNRFYSDIYRKPVDPVVE